MGRLLSAEGRGQERPSAGAFYPAAARPRAAPGHGPGAGQPALVERWSLPMRLVHWGFALAFLGLLGSGLALGQPSLRGIPLLGSKLVREIHLTCAVLLFLLPALAASWDGYREIRRQWAAARWLGARDWRWLLALPLRAVRRGPLPPRGRFNAGQKLNVYAVLVLVAGLAGTGLVIAPEAGRPVPQAVRGLVYEVHVLLAWATIPLVVGHVFLAALFPPTRPALRGMWSGKVRAAWAAEHHGADEWTTGRPVRER